MPAGHIHRRMMGGSSLSYVQYIESLGGTIRFYYPMTESSQSMDTTYPPSTPWNMTAGTITNNSYGGGIIANGGLTKNWNGGHTAPEGVAGVEYQSGESGATVVVTRDINDVWNVTQAYASIWLSMDSDQITKNGHLLLTLGGVTASMQLRADPVSNNITAFGQTLTLTGSTWLNPVHIVLQESYAESATTSQVIVNGVELYSGTPHSPTSQKGPMLRPGNWQTEGSVGALPARYYYGATSWLCVTGAAPSVAQHLATYNTFKDK